MIRANNLGYTFASGRVGIASVDLEVSTGELLALVGPNGSGKTTLLRLLAGDLGPTDGALLVLSNSPAPKLSKSRVTFAPAQPIHFDELTGRENARFFARACGAADDAVRHQLTAFNLIGDAEIPVAEYSFGMRRKLLLAEALAPEPALLLLDEPTIGLDPPAIATLTDALLDHVRAGNTVIIGTNDVRFALLATRVVFLHLGRKVADGKPDELLRSARGTTRIDVTLTLEPARALSLPPGVTATKSAGSYSFETNDAGVLPALSAALLSAGARIGAVRMREPDLGDVFQQLTGEALDRNADV